MEQLRQWEVQHEQEVPRDQKSRYISVWEVTFKIQRLGKQCMLNSIFLSLSLFLYLQHALEI